MKYRIFITTYGPSVLLAILLAIRLSLGATNFEALCGTVFVFAVLSKTLLTDKCFVESYYVTNDTLYIKYITQFFQSRSFEASITNIHQVKHIKRTNLLFWSPALELKYDEQWHEFVILSRDLHSRIKQDFITNFESGDDLRINIKNC